MRVVMRRVAVKLGESQIRRLKQLSVLRGVPYSELIRRAIDEYLDRELGRLSDEAERIRPQVSP